MNNYHTDATDAHAVHHRGTAYGMLAASPGLCYPGVIATTFEMLRGATSHWLSEPFDINRTFGRPSLSPNSPQTRNPRGLDYDRSDAKQENQEVLA